MEMFSFAEENFLKAIESHRTGQYREAVKHYQGLVNKIETIMALQNLRLKDFTDFQSMHGRKVKNKQLVFLIFMNFGAALHALGDYGKALRMYTHAKEVVPADNRNNLNLAAVLLILARSKEDVKQGRDLLKGIVRHSSSPAMQKQATALLRHEQ
jgi:tetratricopeptide (TPR) repeat protein